MERISNRKIDESIQSAPCEESEESIGRVLNKSENVTNLRKLSSNLAWWAFLLSIIRWTTPQLTASYLPNFISSHSFMCRFDLAGWFLLSILHVIADRWWLIQASSENPIVLGSHNRFFTHKKADSVEKAGRFKGWLGISISLSTLHLHLDCLGFLTVWRPQGSKTSFMATQDFQAYKDEKKYNILKV